MADPLIAVEQLRAYLIGEGIAQDMNETPSTSLPSIWLAPRQGAPEPRAGEATTITLNDTALGSPSTLEPFIEEAFIEVIVRARNAGVAKLLHRSIRGKLAPDDLPGGRKQWMMGDLLVENSFVWRPEQPMRLSDEGVTYDRVQAFCISARVKALNGEPLTP